MRSSKSRSRNKSNRNRSVGNIVNRVFDSSGPEGKVRGTPQQIIDKYNQLARDAQLGGDRVATENFQQHAEHYLRMLGSAQKEQEKQREQQDAENRKRQSERDRERAKQDSSDQQEAEQSVPGGGDQPDVIDASGNDSESGLVETPEEARSGSEEPASKPKRSYNRKPRAKKDSGNGDGKSGEDSATAAE
ncbi:hypothetical protein OB2597_03469 [Pseudooceanicola batsensis HTCC2597]|uniref:DUF4167 domain-containing protein n=1 Tax=Pseudooceanicola batsensis (strain ATCC BAA-863 / DSM 15984 / KCTC 12145 / HTCC2597) TaxID=252305 RepID=A3U418_PSEBH|nr:DUF4167 domain-containing protein [Pseudooceanicola batsensis]EAQ01065.1 hypothetical protein OB2597_03469 [Pseudooceanicola batsensis HTCC2597]